MEQFGDNSDEKARFNRWIASTKCMASWTRRQIAWEAWQAAFATTPAPGLKVSPQAHVFTFEAIEGLLKWFLTTGSDMTPYKAAEKFLKEYPELAAPKAHPEAKGEIMATNLLMCVKHVTPYPCEWCALGVNPPARPDVPQEVGKLAKDFAQAIAELTAASGRSGSDAYLQPFRDRAKEAKAALLSAYRPQAQPIPPEAGTT